ncbi:MAG: hypothetical protein JW714_04520 [Candidatus Omnitrophica bacterium]|nr:hypothetical protein [Candidatus Omnitrophota bacterium]
MRNKSWQALALLLLLLVLITNLAQAETPRRNWNTLGEFNVSGRIVEINQDYRFAIINLGSADGVKKGMVLTIFQNDEEVAKIRANKVRRHITACDIQIVYAGRGIGVGDMVIYKSISPLRKVLKPLEAKQIIEVEPIVVDIDAPKREILKKSLAVFKEFGVVVTDSDFNKYSFKACKEVSLPLELGLLTEWGPSVRNRVLYTVEVQTTPRYNRLVIRLRSTYDREGQAYNHEIEKSSTVYREAQEMAFTIKDLTERL